MWIKVVKDGMSNDYETKSKWVGSAFVVIGSITVIYALFSVMALHSVIGIALLITAVIAMYWTAKINPAIVISWLKSLHLLFFGIIFLFLLSNELATIVSSVGLFLLIETILKLILAYITRENTTAVAWLVNAALSALICFMLLLGLENVSEPLIGIFVGLILAVDGATLLYSGRKIYIRP